ncbi:hypothetical protein GTY54_34595 [Streptomyces sp. SID625]|nr:hypothetical protein [Streptomyces sp. SID625]
MKKTIRENYRVEVTPDPWRNGLSHDQMKALLVDLEKSVRRHVDGFAEVVQRWDTRYECSHCDSEWEALTEREAADPSFRQDEHSVGGEPVCCYEAIAEFRAEHGVPPLAGANLVPDMTPGACTHHAMARHLGGDASRWSCLRCGLEVGTRGSGPDRPVHPLWPAEVVPEGAEGGAAA